MLQRAPRLPEMGLPERRALSALAAGSSRRAGRTKVRRVSFDLPLTQGLAVVANTRREVADDEKRVARLVGRGKGRWACGTKHRPTTDRCGIADSSGEELVRMVRPPMIRRPAGWRRGRCHGNAPRVRADSCGGRCQAEDRDATHPKAARPSGHARQASALTIAASARPMSVTRPAHQRICTGFLPLRRLLRGLQRA